VTLHLCQPARMATDLLRVAARPRAAREAGALRECRPKQSKLDAGRTSRLACARMRIRAELIVGRAQAHDVSMTSVWTSGLTSGETPRIARTDERRRPRDLAAGRASGHARREGRVQRGRGTEWGFSGRLSPRLHVVKQERPRVTAVLCRGRSSRGITCPKSSSRHPVRFPAGLVRAI
jgi:hypothetical protein